MVAITTTSLSSANSAVSENKCTSAIFAQIDRQHPHRHHPYHSIPYYHLQNVPISFFFFTSHTFIHVHGILWWLAFWLLLIHISVPWAFELTMLRRASHDKPWESLYLLRRRDSRFSTNSTRKTSSRLRPNLGKCSLPLSLWAGNLSCLGDNK